MIKSQALRLSKRFFQKIHKFYFVFAFCAGIVFGFLFFALFNFNIFEAKIWLTVIAAIIILSLFFKRFYLIILMFFAGIIFAGFQMNLYNINNNLAQSFIGETVVVKGIISEDPDISENKMSLRLQTLSVNGEEISAKIYVSLTSKIDVRRSDEIELSDKMNAGFGAFSGTIYRPEIKKITKKPDFIRDLRDSFATKIRDFLPSPAADLGLGYLLGQKNSLPVELDEALKLTALTHIVVASGYNLTVLIRFSRRFFIRISKNFALFMSIILVCGFVLVVGFSPSMTRAGIVAILSLIAWFFGRKFNPLFLLCLVAAATLIINPGNIYDLGWQLSFASFFGVMILAPRLKNYFYGEQEKINSLTQIFFETISAQIVTLPLILYTFGAFSTVSVFANLVVLPFVPAAMLFTFLTGIFGFILPIFAPIFAFVAKFILEYSIYMINFFASFSGAQFPLNISEITVGMAYFVIIAGCFYLNKEMSEAQIQDNLVV